MKTLLVIVLLVLAGPSVADDGNAVVGLWLTEEHDARIEMFRDGDTFGGKIVWIEEPLFFDDDPDGMAGKPKECVRQRLIQRRPICQAICSART